MAHNGGTRGEIHIEDFRDLIEAARRGDQQAREMLLRSNLSGLRAYIRLHTGELVRAKESISDLVQSVCREVLEDLPDYTVETDQAFRHWLFTSARRKILDRKKYWEAEKRKPAREVTLTPNDSDEQNRTLLLSYGALVTPSRHAAVREEISRVEQAFEQLPEDYREVITLARLVGLSHREIAVRMGRNEEAVRQLLVRARARLARLLAADR